ncbi:hypothetical protein CK203_047007 [Vitis vinifera]|uniref:Reverse transcriptase domain-containing protein n=1 Tax=Vitis vinifera TaxID=29760 RepID=A0A438FWI9_VITVI|nr:hypothetical protein CK203_047007 [Vitis vinifera]
MVRTLKVSVERKTFLVRFEGESGGIWCSLTEHSRGSVFASGFEKEEVGWLIKHLAKAIELKTYMGFNRKYRGKSKVHLMEVCFNNHGRFIRLSKFASNKRSTFLVIPEGERGKGWEQLKNAFSSMLMVPSSNIVEKERQCRVENINYKQARVGRALAKFLGQKGVVTIVPFSGGKEQWGTVTKIDWRTMKLYDLCKTRVRILMKEHSVLPALIEVLDGGWVFTISIAVVGAGEERRVREMTDKLKDGVGNQKAERTHGKRRADEGNNCVQPSSPLNLNSNKERIGSFGPKLLGPVTTLGQEMDGKQPNSRKGFLRSEDSSAMGKGKSVLVGRRRSEPLTQEIPSSDFVAPLKDVAFEAGTQMVQRFSSSPLILSRPLGFRSSCSGEGASSSRDRENSEGFGGFAHHDSSVLVFPSNPVTSEKGLTSVGTCGLMVVENNESPTNCRVAPKMFSKKNDDDCPIKAEFSSLGGFQIDGLSPRKMAKVREVLSSLDIKCIPSGRADSPQVFETCSIWLGGNKKEEYDRRFVGSVWSGPTPFRFENTWLQHPSFKDCFRSWWRGFQGAGWEGHKFMRKLQFVKAKLKEWNKESFGVLKEGKKHNFVILLTLMLLSKKGFFLLNFHTKSFEKGELEELILREEVHWRQKLRKFIKFLENERGLVLNNIDSITEEILLFYEKLYSSPPGESWRDVVKSRGKKYVGGFHCKNRIRVSHLQFADDTIFFSSTCVEEQQTLKFILLVFGQIYGLKVNLDKSNLYGINLDQDHLSKLALLLDCKVSDWPILYLGLPLGGNPKACGF